IAARARPARRRVRRGGQRGRREPDQHSGDERRRKGETAGQAPTVLIHNSANGGPSAQVRMRSDGQGTTDLTFFLIVVACEPRPAYSVRYPRPVGTIYGLRRADGRPGWRSSAAGSSWPLRGTPKATTAASVLAGG
ncbi:MAG: hypothetical protein QOF99_8878, partial [Pseudonocardiales bacterium]|nr:hypothetical protein [Pseudonocardiales bacterium]